MAGERGVWKGAHPSVRLRATLIGLAALATTSVAPVETVAAGSENGHGRGIPAAARGPVPRGIEVALGKGAVPAVGGGFNVTLADGRVVHTHGPDTRESLGGDGSALAATAPTRPPFCVDDPATQYHQRVLYAYVSGRTNNATTQIPNIRTIFAQLNHRLNEASLASSGGATPADYRVACNSAGDIDVGVFSTKGTSFADVANAAAAAGFTNPKADHSIFLDWPASTYCGIAHFYDDDRLTADNYNNNPSGIGASYAVTYGGPSATSSSDCWRTTTPMHENGHNQGAVQHSAPHSTGAGHCTDGHDVMCYRDGGPRAGSYSTTRCSTQYFDCGYDDYFDAAPEAGTYLAGKWNIGSPLNRFIEFGTQPTTVEIVRDVVVQENVGEASVVVRRLGDPSTSFEVDFSASPAIATEDDFGDGDRTRASGNPLRFAAGETVKRVPVPIVNDAAREGIETVNLSLSNIRKASGPVEIRQARRRVIIRPSDQQPDEYIKLRGGSYRGSNIYNLTGSAQWVYTSARRGQTRTFYFSVQNDGNVRNRFTVRLMNSSGTSILVNRSRAVTRSIRSRSGRAVYLDPGKRASFRVDFKMGYRAYGREQITATARWAADRVLKDVVKGYVRVR